MGNWGKKWTSFSSPYDIVECAAAASPVAADTAACLAVRAEDGEVSIFSHPFSTLVLCFQFPLGCMIISSIFCYLTVTIPSFSFSFTFLVFLFTINSLSFMPSPSLFFNYKPMGPWASHALCGSSSLLVRVHTALRGPMVTTCYGKLRHTSTGIYNFMTLILRVS